MTSISRPLTPKPDRPIDPLTLMVIGGIQQAAALPAYLRRRLTIPASGASVGPDRVRAGCCAIGSPNPGGIVPAAPPPPAASGFLIT